MGTSELCSGSVNQTYWPVSVALVGHRKERALEFLEKAVVLGTRFNDAVSLSTAQIYIETAKAERVSARVRPIDVRKQRELALLRRVLQRDVPLLQQPSV